MAVGLFFPNYHTNVGTNCTFDNPLAFNWQKKHLGKCKHHAHLTDLRQVTEEERRINWHSGNYTGVGLNTVIKYNDLIF